MEGDIPHGSARPSSEEGSLIGGGEVIKLCCDHRVIDTRPSLSFLIKLGHEVRTRDLLRNRPAENPFFEFYSLSLRNTCEIIDPVKRVFQTSGGGSNGLAVFIRERTFNVHTICSKITPSGKRSSTVRSAETSYLSHPVLRGVGRVRSTKELRVIPCHNPALRMTHQINLCGTGGFQHFIDKFTDLLCGSLYLTQPVRVRDEGRDSSLSQKSHTSNIGREHAITVAL